MRGALGEDTDCPASRFGKVLQDWILNGLQRAGTVACVSEATQRDLNRLVGTHVKSEVVFNGLNQSLGVLGQAEIAKRISEQKCLLTKRVLTDRKPFILHVGSTLRRKNRDGIIRIFEKASRSWDGNLVFAGAPLTPELNDLCHSLKINDRTFQIVGPDPKTLETLYNRAYALLFPSRFEGFGWPVIEAQACGCPVLISDRCSLPEIAGASALVRAIEDEDGFAQDIISLGNDRSRREWSERGLANSLRFSTSNMLKKYESIYQRLLAAS